MHDVYGQGQKQAAQLRGKDSEIDLRVERVTRIELALSAWEADVLPLNYTRERPHCTR